MSLRNSYSNSSPISPITGNNCHQYKVRDTTGNGWPTFWSKFSILNKFPLPNHGSQTRTSLKQIKVLLLLLILILISTISIQLFLPIFPNSILLNFLHFYLSLFFATFVVILFFIFLIIVSLLINRQSSNLLPPTLPSVVDNCQTNLIHRTNHLRVSEQQQQQQQPLPPPLKQESTFNNFYIQFQLNIESSDSERNLVSQLPMYNSQSLNSRQVLSSSFQPKLTAKSFASRHYKTTPASRGFSLSAILSYDLYCCALLLLLVGLLFSPIKGSIRPNCRCVIFDDTFGKEYGIFTSPNWPVPYDNNLECLLYTFVAAPDQIVEITFDEFDVQKNSDVGCDYGDYIKLYLHLNMYGGITERTAHSAVLCGKFPDIEQTHFSSNSTLIFEFHSDFRSGNNTGFRGTFRFLNKLLFHTDGQLLPNSVCDYVFTNPKKTSQSNDPATTSGSSFELARKIHSIEEDEASEVASEYRQKTLLAAAGDKSSPNQTDFEEMMLSSGSNQVETFRSLSNVDYSYQSRSRNQSRASSSGANQNRLSHQFNNGRSLMERGYFYSPQYPSTYPKNTRCSFTFRANRNERIRLLFVDVSLQKADQSCIESPDLINIYDGLTAKSDLMGQICGQSSYVELLSGTNFAFVQFIAKSHISARGFKAQYAFVPVTSSYGPLPPGISFANGTGTGTSLTNHQFSSLSPVSGGFGTDPTTTSAASCDQWFSSDDALNGTLTSPNYPLPYPANVKCQYHFIGRGKERVQVLFQEFDIHKVEDQHRDCETSDSVTAYITTNGQKEWIDDFCGSDLPPQIMSNGHRLTIEFKSLGHNKLPSSSSAAEPVDSVNSAISSKRKNVAGGGSGRANSKKNKNGNSRKVQSKQKHHQFSKSKSKPYPNFPVEESLSSASALALSSSKSAKSEQQQSLYNSEINYASRAVKRSTTSTETINDKSGQANIEKSNDQETGKSMQNINGQYFEIENEKNPLFLQADEPGEDDYDEDDEDDDGDDDGRTKNLGIRQNKGLSPSKKSHSNSNRHQAKGFRATYRFVTNFGINTGKQDSKSVCGFVFNSTETKNGTFTSPNYPGLYPKDTECHYFFYGNSSERVHIVFTNFDVEGVKPCTLETASDYVEFSNFYSADRKMYRHCGLKHPKSVESEGDFFRVTFKSNGRFDGTGFKAIYTFKINEGYQIKKIRSSVSTSMSTSSAISTQLETTFPLLVTSVIILLAAPVLTTFHLT